VIENKQELVVTVTEYRCHQCGDKDIDIDGDRFICLGCDTVWYLDGEIRLSPEERRQNEALKKRFQDKKVELAKFWITESCSSDDL
jgi:hypothetical protein